MEKKLYELNSSQEVVELQCRYTLFKRIINILASVKVDREIDRTVMTKAFNILLERHDCLRLRFIKKDKKLMQYFIDKDEINDIPYIEFKTKQEQDAFIKKQTKKAIKYLDGVVIEPYFCKTYDGKFMVFVKVCHYILDIYGLNMVLQDLIKIYDALTTNSPLPEAPGKFENVLIKDIAKKHDGEAAKKNFEFFNDVIDKSERPSYAGIHGSNNKLWQKQVAKNKTSMKMYFIHNDTKGHLQYINAPLVEKVLEFCKGTRFTIANVLFYACSVCASRMNGDVKTMLPLELCNCRNTAAERACAGTKVQSIGCFTTVDKEQTFMEGMTNFATNQNKLYRHFGFKDRDFEDLLHKKYKFPLLETMYSITFSFMPYEEPEGLELDVYSNEKCALIAYLGFLYNTRTNEIKMTYDCQTKIISDGDVDKFHKNYCSVIEQIVNNPEIKIKDIKVEN